MSFRTILCLFCLLLVFAPAKSYEFSHGDFSRKLLPILTENPLINAYFTGNKRHLPRELKKVHQKLNLQHLMTPSGLHLASFLLVLSFFIKDTRLIFIALLIIGLILFPFSGIDSLKRMILFGLIRKNPFKNISLKVAFLLTFSLTLLGGQYSSNPLSFSLSFVFLGALLYAKNRILMFSSLLLVQILLAQWLDKTLDPLGALFGLLLSLLSPLLFPLFAVEIFWKSLPFSGWWIVLIKKLASFCLIPLRLPILSFFPFLLLFPKKRLRLVTLLTCTLLVVTPLGSPKNTLGFETPPPRGFLKKMSLKNGTKFIYANGMRCYSRLKEDTWNHHCYK